MREEKSVRIKNTSPVVVIGRGGSGTRILADLVQEQGVFLGNKLNKSIDAVEWVKTIYGAVIDAHSAPYGLSPEKEEMWIRKIRRTAREILEERGTPVPDFWGWKLPETTLVIPQVLASFPHARIIHLIRHPVSSCCRRSHMTSRTDTELGQVCLTRAYDFIGRPVAKIGDDETHIHNAASWAFQVSLAVRALEDIKDESRTLLVKYEAICDDPTACRDDIRQFLGMDAARSPQGLQIDTARRNENAVDPEQAAAVWDICGEQAIRLGYGRDNVT